MQIRIDMPLVFRGLDGEYTLRVGRQLFRNGSNVAPTFRDVDEALLALGRAGIEVLDFDRITLRGTVRKECQHHREIPVIPRRGNIIAVEIAAPADRCMLRCPDGRGAVWLLSGGSILDYGLCTPDACPSGAPCFNPPRPRKSFEI